MRIVGALGVALAGLFVIGAVTAYGQIDTRSQYGGTTAAVVDDKGNLRVPADYQTTYQMLGSWAVAKDDGPPPVGPTPVVGLRWRGDIPPQKWMNFYTKVLSRFAFAPGMKLEVHVSVPPGEHVTPSKIEETRSALRELGLDERLDS